MLKFELDSLEGLDEAHKSFYEEKDGKYTLKVDGLPQPNSEELEGLRRNRDELLAEKKAEQQKRKEAEEKARKDAEENAKKTGDIEALEKSWQEKLSKRETELLEKNQQYEARIHNLTVVAEASKLASKLAIQGSESVLLPHIAPRLQAEFVNGEVKFRVLDKQGKPSAMTIDDLEKEIRSDVAFKPMIRASSASGSGASGANGGSATKKPNEMTNAERIEWQRTDPQGFAQATANGEFNTF